MDIKSIKVSASIVVYNEDKNTLYKVINSFLGINCIRELIIIDNSPQDDLRKFCTQYDLKYIYPGENLGFGRAHNMAFQHFELDSQIHIIINPDIYFDSKEIETYLSFMLSNKDISLSTPLVCSMDGEIQHTVRNIPTVLGIIKRKFKIDSDEIKIDLNKINEIPFAHGCFLVFQTEVFRKLNGFDERFFLYLEDVDIFIRSKRYGKTVIYPSFKVFHEFRKSSSTNLKLFVVHLISFMKFFLKYYKYIK